MSDAAPTAPAVEQGMHVAFSAAQEASRREFRAFVEKHVTPHAGLWDRERCIPGQTVQVLRSQGFLGAPLPVSVGGGGMDALTYGLLTEELARGCSSLRSLLTVHDMVTWALWRWGNAKLKADVVPLLAKGELLGALALSEPNVGSDAAAVETTARDSGDEFILDGRKKWITFGQIADYFLVLARCGDQLGAFLVPASTPGLHRQPIADVIGTRASMLAELSFDGCRIPRDHLVGKLGFGLSHVVSTALDLGRYSVAWGAVGIAQACLDACLAYTDERRQFGKPLREHQLVQQILTEMIVDVRAARLLCCRAGYLEKEANRLAATETLIAKYFASRVAVRAANDAVQLHGANGLSESYPVERYLRDAKVMEIIEGSTQIQQITIARYPPPEL